MLIGRFEDVESGRDEFEKSSRSYVVELVGKACTMHAAPGSNFYLFVLGGSV